MSSGCSLEADNVFGPVVSHACRDGFDFTLLFEQSILGLLHALAFLLASPLRVRHLAKRDVRTRSNTTRMAKLVIALGFAALQLTLLVCWARSVTPRTKVSVPFSTINLVVAMEIMVLSWMEDARSARPSSLLNLYLLLTLLFDIAQARTLWLARSGVHIPILFTTSVAAKTTMLLLESLEKREYLTGKYQDLPPESTSGIVNRTFMWWLNRLFLAGFRSLLTVGDLFILDKRLASVGLAKKAQRAWTQRRSPERRFEFPWQMCRALWWPLVSAVFPRLCLIGFTFAQPFLITSTLDWLNDPHSAENKGYGLIGATVLIYLGLAIFTLHYDHKLYRFLTMFRGAASSLIYEHALRIPDGELEDRSATITLMTTDIDRITACLANLNECWARAIEVVIGITLLALRLGWVSLMPVIIVIVSSLGSTQISKNIGNRQKVWVDAVQQRIAITSSMLAEIQIVRRMGLSKTFTKLIQDQRVQETHRMAGYRRSIVWQNMIQNLPWALAPALTFVVYASQGQALDITNAFSSLSVITLLTIPASKLLSAIPSTAAAVGCFDRVQAFLLTPIEQYNRRIVPDAVKNPLVHTHLRSDSLVSLPSRNSDSANPSSPVIVMDSVSIRPLIKAKPVLQNITFQVPQGALVMVQGPVGSGKSTLLRTILGQAVCESGVVTVAIPRPAYCAQTPWLSDSTIRDAICGGAQTGPAKGQPIDREWYEAVLHACALAPDLMLLPKGDATQISGGSGPTLSGGQMHRVALARAVYARRKLVLLDDVFSALDRKTKAVIMERLFGGNGLLRRLKSTVILVIHETEYLSYADQVLVLSDGNLRQEEAHERKLRQPSSFPTAANERDNEGEYKEPTIKDIAARLSQRNQINDLKRATGDFAVYKYYLRYIGWSKITTFLIFVIVHVVCSTYSQIWLKRWANRGGGQKPLYVTVYLLLAIFNTVGIGGYVWAILVLISPATARRLHYVVLKTVMRASPRFLATTDSGTILNRFSQDMTLIESQLPVGVLIAVTNLFSAVASAALIATGSSYMAITVPFLIIAVLVLQHFYLRTSRQMRLLDLESKSPLYSHFLDTVKGLATIQAFGWEDDFRTKNLRLLDNSQRPHYLLYCIQRWLTLALDLIAAAEAVILVSLAVFLRHSTNVGLLGVSLNNVLTFNSSLSSLISGWTQLEISLGSISRVKDFEMEVAREEEYQKMEPPRDWPDQGAIEFSGVTAQYSPDAIALKGVSFKAYPGQKIGICGRTGSGKSSLLSTLLGMLDITSGSVVIDNIDLAAIPRETVREQVITIPQDPLLLVGCTVRLNVDPAGQLSDADLIAALDRVGLWTDVLEARGGLDAEIKDALSLSRGQQQLLELARAMLKLHVSHSKIVLLDEATSGVDVETDARMQDILRQAPFNSCTILTVAHRVSTIRDSDLVIVLDKGRVVEMGKPGVLAGQNGSNFASLLNI
ncbi:multidrug resistance-associated protein [Aspergillus sclerotioniger CBS 115572]|uniref:Multidrug resistance-associated protein n=1 Tax=Aspergillus sclerotioniger CBS 115572 TaxID=1450535 RepID=A0A317XCZ4_9EURO|nr:multidrug resistance-associated protein [Aspergillus sclerotioniger CBS 115572]PWY94818.1 multidrug resistance-associated protein [Aspergillus sclerotioniger CBS 115572]